jgi:flavin reductase (DIM6/NTAB) family NADH-FMN oxidoreductase RutF
MHLPPIPIPEFVHRPYHLWESQWLLLTSGDFEAGDYNAMTVAWGSFGVMWSKPFALVVVRPTRHTYGFIEKYETFTLTAFPKEQHKALQLLGTRSGRDGDKIAQAGLTPIPSIQVAAPAFAEAELVIECRKTYWDDLNPEHFLETGIEKNYPARDYHRMYFGEIVAISGVDTFLQR